MVISITTEIHSHSRARIQRFSVGVSKHTCIDRTLFLQCVPIHIATIPRALQGHIFPNWDQDTDENRCNFWSPHSNPHFQAVVHTSNPGPGGTEFPSGCHSVFPVTPASGHGSDDAPIAGSHQERACEPGLRGREVGKEAEEWWASWGPLEWEKETSNCLLVWL